MSLPRRIPIADWVWGAAALIVAVIEWTFVFRFGPAPVYLLNGAINTGLALTVLLRRTFVVPSALAAYALLAALAMLVRFSPVNLGVTALLVCAPLSLIALTRFARSPWWGVGALIVGGLGSIVSPAVRLSASPAYAIAVHVLVLTACYLWASGRRREARLHQREVEQQAARATEAERARIARELHDIVAHSLAVVQVQASTGLAIGGEDRLRESLTTIKSTSKQALGEVRSLVQMLREDTGGGPSGSLAGLGDLVAEARAAGVRLDAALPDSETLERWQQAWPLPQRLTLVRIVREGLTNVIKHGGERPRARLWVGFADGICRLEIHNHGSVPSALPGGHGLIGLRERVMLVGGTLDAGPDGAGGFRLTASFGVPAKENP